MATNACLLETSDAFAKTETGTLFPDKNTAFVDTADDMWAGGKCLMACSYC